MASKKSGHNKIKAKQTDRRKYQLSNLAICHFYIAVTNMFLLGFEKKNPQPCVRHTCLDNEGSEIGSKKKHVRFKVVFCQVAIVNKNFDPF